MSSEFANNLDESKGSSSINVGAKKGGQRCPRCARLRRKGRTSEDQNCVALRLKRQRREGLWTQKPWLAYGGGGEGVDGEFWLEDVCVRAWSWACGRKGTPAGGGHGWRQRRSSWSWIEISSPRKQRAGLKTKNPAPASVFVVISLHKPPWPQAHAEYTAERRTTAPNQNTNKPGARLPIPGD